MRIYHILYVRADAYKNGVLYVQVIVNQVCSGDCNFMMSHNIEREYCILDRTNNDWKRILSENICEHNQLE